MRLNWGVTVVATLFSGLMVSALAVADNTTQAMAVVKPAGADQVVDQAKVASYSQSREQFLNKPKEGKKSATKEQKAVMNTFNQQLAVKMPDPGLKVGQKAPNFSLKNPFGKTVTLYEELRKGPVVLVFYRGAWCPFCNLHLRALQQSLPQIKGFGGQLITVTPQTPDRSAKQFSESDFTFEVLSDNDSQVMKDYQLYFELTDEFLAVYKEFDIDVEAHNGAGRKVLPVPGSFVIDQEGIIQAQHASTDYKQRMEPGVMISTLKTIADNF